MSDTTDDLDYAFDLLDIDDDLQREYEWSNGRHTTKAGDFIKIEDMKTSPFTLPKIIKTK